MGSMKPLVRRRSTSTSRLTSARCSSLCVLRNRFVRRRRARPRHNRRDNRLRRMRLRSLAGNSRNPRSRPRSRNTSRNLLCNSLSRRSR